MFCITTIITFRAMFNIMHVIVVLEVDLEVKSILVANLHFTNYH